MHVHTYPDVDSGGAAPPVAEYIKKAVDAGLGVLGITDHNDTRNIREAVALAERTPLVVLPGVEISTHEGHLLALFAANAIPELEALAQPANLQLKPVVGSDDQRSQRSMLDLVSEISSRGGLAIPAHVDAEDGINQRMAGTALTDLLRHTGLAGIEFATHEALRTWFTDQDDDSARLNAWRAREAVEQLRDRGLARVMSSDAHSLAKVGKDRSRRTLTRLRLDEPNYVAVVKSQDVV